MQVICPHCRNDSFSVSQDGTVCLHCLVCGTRHSVDAVIAEKQPKAFVKPRLQWVVK